MCGHDDNIGENSQMASNIPSAGNLLSTPSLTPLSIKKSSWHRNENLSPCDLEASLYTFIPALYTSNTASLGFDSAFYNEIGVEEFGSALQDPTSPPPMPQPAVPEYLLYDDDDDDDTPPSTPRDQGIQCAIPGAPRCPSMLTPRSGSSI